MSIENELLYTKEHEWIKYNSDTNIATIGITNFAQQSLGDIVFVDTPKLNTTVKANQVVGSVESVKSVSDIYSPLSGEVVDVNKTLDNNPELINTTPYEAGWMFAINVSHHEEIKNLLDLASYQKFIL